MVTPAAGAQDRGETARPRSAPLRGWTVALGLLLIVPDAYWIVQTHNVRIGPYTTILTIFANCIFLLLLLIAASRLLARWRPAIALSRAELLTIYTMLNVGAALASLDMMPILVEMMTHPYRGSQETVGWLETFGRFLPRGLLVSDPAVLHGYFNGNDTLYRAAYLRVWVPPLLRWSVFILALLFMMLCMSSLLRRPWVERERLAFPTIQLPLHMTEEGGRFWKSRLMWIGFALAGGIDVVNGLSFLIPAFPEIVVKPVDLQGFLTAKPWNAVGWMPITFYPFVIGLGYLLPLDLVFSCWFFFLFWKAQLILANALAWDVVPNFPYSREQAFGGYMAIAVALIWTRRGHFEEVWRNAWRRTNEADDRREALSCRAALLGLLGSFLFLVGFLWYYGMALGWAVFALLLYVALSLVITRMRAELGPPVHDLCLISPDLILTHAFGSRAMDGSTLAVLNFFWWFCRAQRSHPMPFLLEGQKMSDAAGLPQRSIVAPILLAVVVGIGASFWAFLHLAYEMGAGAKFYAGTYHSNEAYSHLASWIASPSKPDAGRNGAIVVGFLTCAGLLWMRSKFLWWPLHPIGYAITACWSMALVWMPLMIAWAIKLVVLRYGRLKAYRTLEPFFLGLILGEFVVGCLWSLLGLITGAPTYSFWGTE
jgi:hypothetical protein